jgi:transposase-like protein
MCSAFAGTCASPSVYRDLEELMSERNLSVDHTTVGNGYRAMHRKLNKRIRREVKPRNVQNLE